MSKKALVFATFLGCAASSSTDSPQSIEGLERPFGVEMDDRGNLYVAEAAKSRIRRYDGNLKPSGWLGKTLGGNTSGWKSESEQSASGNEPGAFLSPHSVVYYKEKLYVTDYSNARVQRFSREGNFEVEIGARVLKGPASLSINESDASLVVTDYRLNEIFIFEADGKLRHHFKDLGLKSPHMAVVDRSGYMYIADTWNHRIVRLNKEGEFAGWIGGLGDQRLAAAWQMSGKAVEGRAVGELGAPVSVSLDVEQNLIVSEFKNARISRFGIDGSFKGWVGGLEGGGATNRWMMSGLPRSGKDAGTFYEPYDARIRNGMLLVAEKGNQRVQLIPLAK